MEVHHDLADALFASPGQLVSVLGYCLGLHLQTQLRNLQAQPPTAKQVCDPSSGLSGQWITAYTIQ